MATSAGWRSFWLLALVLFLHCVAVASHGNHKHNAKIDDGADARERNHGGQKSGNDDSEDEEPGDGMEDSAEEEAEEEADEEADEEAEEESAEENEPDVAEQIEFSIINLIPVIIACLTALLVALLFVIVSVRNCYRSAHANIALHHRYNGNRSRDILLRSGSDDQSSDDEEPV